ncbi:MAG: four helix bundle protein [Akkermansiaceae bacterium]
MALHTFEDLEVWKRASRLAVDVCSTVHALKICGLKNQIERSAVSIPSNIAEGAERDSDGDFVRFLRISKGSCAELRTQLYITAKLLDQISEPPIRFMAEYIQETREISAMLQGLIFKIQRPTQESEN